MSKYRWKLMGLALAVVLVLGFSALGLAYYNEAPMLKERVAKGELPSVEQRLPKNPLVIIPYENVGRYGGTFHVLHCNPNALEDGVNVIGKETILKLNPEDGATIEPNLATAWEISEDKKTVTLYLREGVKWSDGHPFTADDILFWWEDVILNDELTPVKPTQDWAPGGEMMKVHKIDDYTVELEFAIPYSAVLIRLATWAEENAFYLPKHYLKQFHPRYTDPEELDRLAKAEGFETWWQLFGAKRVLGFNENHQNPEGPVLRAFKPISRTQNRVVFERNPYYWKVDTEGNQLPYVDRVVLELVTDVEVYNLKAATGEMDIAQWNITLDNMPVFLENAERNGYRVLTYQTAWPCMMFYMPNMTHKDPAMRALFGDKRFRIALSLGIDRQEMNDVLFFGMGEPMQCVILPRGGRFWDERLAKLYTEYDPDRANALLDEMGLKWEGDYRVRPDGERVKFTISYWPGDGGTAKAKMLELSARQWAEVLGIDVTVRQLERSYLQTLRENGDYDMTIWHCGQMSDPVWILNPWHTTLSSWESGWAPAWREWIATKGERGEEPPEEVLHQYNLWEVAKTSYDEEEVIAAVKEMQRIHIENMWTFGTLGLMPAPILVNEKVRNIPDTGLMAWDWVYLARYVPEQFYFAE